ncbi:MAG: T9SS type A sorting domain-containing protein [Flavobacteriales bacterium]|nr:T9SS type A sorting domain-containing protein [Flavobacteriales bacterium]
MLRYVFISIALALCSTSIIGQDLVGYWHNWNDLNAPYIELDQVDPRYTVIQVSFAVPAVGTSHLMEFSPAETSQAAFIAQVAAVQANGRKVLISVGGANATVHLDSDTERDEFVSSLLGIMDTYGFDGMDIDLEGSSVAITGGSITAPVDVGIIRMIDAVNTIADAFELAHGVPMMLTMAPETAYVQGGMSAFGGIWGAYLPLIHALRDRIDLLHVQLYNSGSMYGIDGGIYTQGTADFIVSQTEAVILGFNTAGGFFQGLPAHRVAVGLPACPDAAGGGYTDTATVRMAVEYLLGVGPQPGSYVLAEPGGYPDIGGMMTWSINWDAVAACSGAYSYAETFARIFSGLPTSVNARQVMELTVGPVPARDRLGFFPPLLESTGATILDMQGRALVNTPLSAGSAGIDVAHLPAGTYVLVLQGAGGVRHVRFVRE